MKPVLHNAVIAAQSKRSWSTRLERSLGAGVLALLATAGVASAQTISVTNKNVTTAAGVGFNLLNLGSASSSGFVSSTELTNKAGGGLPTPAGTEITDIVFANPGPDANKSGVYAGSTANIATSPISSTNFTKYLVAQGTSGDAGTVTITYSVPQRALQILWGTVGTGDTVTAYNSSGTLVATITGTQVQAAVVGGYTANNNLSLRITGIPAFTSLKMTDNNNNPAFEFLVGQPAPEPASLAVLSTGLAGLGVLRRRRKMAA